MSMIIEKDKQFKEAIGAFIIAFNKLEFGLAYLVALIECEAGKDCNILPKHIGYPFSKKVKILSEFINENMEDLKQIWEELKKEISELNEERRYISHGIIQYFMSNDTTRVYIKKGKTFSSKELNTDYINKLTKRLHEMNTGKKGIHGDFCISFQKTMPKSIDEFP